MQLLSQENFETSCSVPFQRHLLTCTMITLRYDGFCTAQTFCWKLDALENFLKIFLWVLQCIMSVIVHVHGASYFKFTCHLKHFFKLLYYQPLDSDARSTKPYNFLAYLHVYSLYPTFDLMQN